MTPSCTRHGWELADATCEDCGLAFCGSCLFYVSKSAEQPRCVPCALAAAGVRRSRQPRAGRRQRRAIAAEGAQIAAMTDTRAEPDAARPEPRFDPVTDAPPDPEWVTLDHKQWNIRPV